MKLSLLFFGLFAAICSSAQQDVGFIAGKTKGPLPFLKYGLGEDRLGGAKMGFLDTSVLIKVVDSVGADYKVRLSSTHFAWMPKINFLADTALKVKPFYLTSSWLASGNEKYDFVKITLDERLPYRSFQQINPARLIVDIFGATSNTNWITQLNSTKEISNIYHEQIEDDVFRIIIDLKHQNHWGHSIYYEKNRLVIRIKQQPRELKIKNLKIAIDAGHGGENSGASGITTGVKEKDYTLLMAMALKKELEKKKATVFMTRTRDTTLSMIERIDMLKMEEPDLLISIHLNSSSRDSVKGTSTYYRYIGSRPLTQYILSRMLQIGLKEYGNVGSFNFSLSGPTEYPNCLVEVAFLSNREDEALILDPKFHRHVAEKIRMGIMDWLKKIKD